MNVRKKTKNALYNLITASLISEGEVSFLKKNKELSVPFNKDKSYYLLNYLNNNGIKKSIKVEPKKNQFKILLPVDLETNVQKWYKDGHKVFNMKIGAAQLNYDAIIVAINLFGDRKLEGIGIPTTVHKKSLVALSYCMEKTLGVTVFSGNSQLKIPGVTELLIGTMDNVSTLDSSEMANYLTDQDMSKVKEVIAGEGD